MAFREMTSFPFHIHWSRQEAEEPSAPGSGVSLGLLLLQPQVLLTSCSFSLCVCVGMCLACLTIAENTKLLIKEDFCVNTRGEQNCTTNTSSSSSLLLFLLVNLCQQMRNTSVLEEKASKQHQQHPNYKYCGLVLGMSSVPWFTLFTLKTHGNIT